MRSLLRNPSQCGIHGKICGTHYVHTWEEGLTASCEAEPLRKTESGRHAAPTGGTAENDEREGGQRGADTRGESCSDGSLLSAELATVVRRTTSAIVSASYMCGVASLLPVGAAAGWKNGGRRQGGCVLAASRSAPPVAEEESGTSRSSGR
ncbi:hypothetical protein MRX96_012734 [Rhipicephalus microplus]